MHDRQVVDQATHAGADGRRAIVEGARHRDVALVPVADFRSITGKGVVGTVEGRQVAVGSRAFAEAAGTIPDPLKNHSIFGIIDGRVVMKDREILTVDMDAIRAALTKRLPRLMQRLEKITQ